MELDQLFDGMAKSDLKGKGNYLPPGFTGRVKMKPLRWNPTGFNGKSAVFEYTLLTSNLDAHPPGCTRSWVIKIEAKNQFAGSDAKQIMMALSGVDVNKVRAYEVDPAPHNEAMSDFKDALKDPASIEGLEALLETVAYNTKGTTEKPSKLIALHKWAPTPEGVATRAEALKTAA